MRSSILAPLFAAGAVAQPGCAGPEPTECHGACVYLHVSLHVEGWQDTEATEYRAHLAVIEETLGPFEANGGRVTMDLSGTFLDGCLAHGGQADLARWRESGHAFGVHGTTAQHVESYGGAREAFGRLRSKAGALGVNAVHASGVCTDEDWVTALRASGYRAVSGTSAFCLQSYDEADLPDAYRLDYDCASPGECHYPVPGDVQAVLHPWFAERGANWLTGAPTGLQVFAQAGNLSCLDEYSRGETHAGCPYTQADNDAILDRLDASISASDPSRINVVGATWSLGSSPDPQLLGVLLDEVRARVDGGSVVWKTLPELISDVELRRDALAYSVQPGSDDDSPSSRERTCPRSRCQKQRSSALVR